MQSASVTLVPLEWVSRSKDLFDWVSVTKDQDLVA